MSKNKTITVDGVEYVRADSIKKEAQKFDGMEYCIVRTYSAGVFAGYVKERKGNEARMLNARRLWYWDGAASLSQLSVNGVSKPENCKFPCEVANIELVGVLEVIPCTLEAQDSIANVKEWKE